MTLRHGWEQEPESGDYVSLVTDSGVFADAMVTFVTSISIEDFVEQDFEKHRKYHSPKELCQAMNFFYPDTDFSPDTELILIGFDVIENWDSSE